ncbi:hypothetical protein [Fodinibius sp. Rm-B-1B1-1]|uniref:hypothetical protein n=1 Tax=Fodinibius alkaliphilus TaxID=3140241 RepID=UPI00315A8161
MSMIKQERIAICRAAMATSIAKNIGMPIANPNTHGSQQLGGKKFFTICSYPPVGYPMEAELFPLEAIMRDIEIIDESGNSEEETITRADHKLEEINAFVHDRLLNPILPLKSLTPPVSSLNSINEVYGDTLEEAIFAGKVAASSDRYKKAMALLFQDGERSEALKKYLEYEKHIQEIRAKLQSIDEDTSERKDLEAKLDRLEAEWIGIGSKNEIEEAFRIIKEESASAGFEDERKRLLDQFKAGEKKRIDAAGLSYFKVQIAPISPLFNNDSDVHWQRVKLQADEIRDNIDSTIAKDVVGIPEKQIERTAQNIRHISFEFLKCSILRDWLDPDFFDQGFWRLESDQELLSDGEGSGRLPTLLKNIIFIRDAEVVFEGEATAYFGDSDKRNIDNRMVMPTLQVLPDKTLEKVGEERELTDAAEHAGLSESLQLLDQETKRSTSLPKNRILTMTKGFDKNDEQLESNDVQKSSFHSLNATLVQPQVHAIPINTEKENKESSSKPKIHPLRSSDVSRIAKKIRPNIDLRPINLNKGGSTNEEEQPQVSIKITGEIVTTDDHPELLDEVSLSFVSLDGDREVQDIELKKSSHTRLIIKRDVVWKSKESPQFEFILKDKDGDELDRRIVKPDKSENKLNLKWTLNTEPVLVELAGKHTPTLHGYGLEVVPLCPNPDEDLEWEY